MNEEAPPGAGPVLARAPAFLEKASAPGPGEKWHSKATGGPAGKHSQSRLPGISGTLVIRRRRAWMFMRAHFQGAWEPKAEASLLKKFTLDKTDMAVGGIDE